MAQVDAPQSLASLSSMGGGGRGGGGTSSTQLAERFPQLDLPQRVDPPPSMNAPPRKAVKTKDEQIRESSFSPAAFSRRKYDIAHIVAQPPPPPPGAGGSAGASSSTPAKSLSAVRKATPSMENKGVMLLQVADFKTLAFSSRRAGRHQMEGVAYFGMAVLHDNMAAYGKALDCYKKFVATCQKLDDRVGEALAYNCIGVDYLHLAAAALAGGPYDGSVSAAAAAAAAGGEGEEEGGAAGAAGKGLRHLQNAAHFTSKHLEIADEAGQFVAHSNLGLAMGSLGEPIQAARHHQEALRLAIRLQSAHGQSIAVGNLGLLGSRQGDLLTAKACMDQHLQLVQSLHDRSAEASAWMQLGLLANKEGAFEQAARYFEQARTIALAQGEQGTLKRANCNIGIARGNLVLRQHMAQLAANAEANKME